MSLMRLFLAVVCLCGAGCLHNPGPSSEPATSPHVRTTARPRATEASGPAKKTAPAPAAADPDLELFKARIHAFTEESLSFITLLENDPDRAELRRHLELVNDAFSRIPENPTNADRRKAYAACKSLWTAM